MSSRASPAFSVVIPTRGRPAQLAGCLGALARADEPPGGFEVIVVDDGGGVELQPIVDAQRGGLELTLLRRPHFGPAAARNAGVEHARGEMLAFTDDDMLVGRRWLVALAERAAAHPGAAIGGRTENAVPGNLCSRVSQLIADRAYSHYNQGPGGPRFFAANNLAFPADAFRDLGGFDPAFRTSEDRDLCGRWHESGRAMAYAEDALARHVRKLDLASFWRQHFGYGRGAFAHYRAARGRGVPLGDRIEPSFHLQVARVAAKRLRTDPREALLIVLWQLANAAGFLREALAAVRKGPAARPNADRASQRAGTSAPATPEGPSR